VAGTVHSNDRSNPTTFFMISQDALNTLFLEAHTHNAWLDRPVPDALLHQLYDVCKMAPTTVNSSPMRIVFVKSATAKEKLKPALSPTNAPKTMAAPVCAIVAMDMRFYEHIPFLSPRMPQAQEWFVGDANRVARETAALRNGSLQGGYLILAARALGLDCGPMSGFDNAMVDTAFFPDGRFKSNFLCNLGYGDVNAVRPRAPRFAFDQACVIA
jgi:3-hydroxypropanoate dehydrogenase